MSRRSSPLRVFALAFGACAVLGAGVATGAAVTAGRFAMFEPILDEPTHPTVDDQPACPSFQPVDPPWLSAVPPAPLSPPEAPRSLEERVAFWTKVWGEARDHVYFLVDERRPWVVHAEIDCRDLSWGADDKRAQASCGERLTGERRKVVQRLKKGGKAVAALYGHDKEAKQLGKKAHEHITSIQGRRDALDRATQRAADELGYVEGLFSAEDVPRIYARAAIVESLWRPEALSRSGAAGAYQFMPKTGKQFLLVEDGVVDERLDPLRSAWAAARYMRSMAKDLGDDWSLVLTAYNTGPSRLKKVMKARGTRDIGKIADAGDWGEFGFDGQNYYAQIVAIGRLTKDDTFEPKPIVGRALRVTTPLSFAELARCTDVAKDKLAEANPSLHDNVVQGGAIVPIGYVALVPSAPVTTAMK